MKKITFVVAALLALSGATLQGRAVTRDQSSMGQYVDDTAITTEIKARFANSPTVAATSIKVVTLNGVVQLSGFAKSASEKSEAEVIAAQVDHVKRVVNDIIVQP